MTGDPWLDRWLAVVGAPRPERAILELGCGHGRDTEILSRRGYGVVAADVSARNLGLAARAAPRARYVRLDLGRTLPFADASFDVAMASLCLHYFEWDRTRAVLAEIRRVLSGGGLLAVRVNSTRDVNHGAVGYPEISPQLYDVDSRPKRFFDRRAIDRLFAGGWAMTSVREMTISRWERPKVVWEVFAAKREA